MDGQRPNLMQGLSFAFAAKNELIILDLSLHRDFGLVRTLDSGLSISKQKLQVQMVTVLVNHWLFYFNSKFIIEFYFIKIVV